MGNQELAIFREHAVAVLAFNREHGRANLSLSRLDRYKPNSATTESRRQDRGLKASCRAVNAQRLACDPTPAVGVIRKQFRRRCHRRPQTGGEGCPTLHRSHDKWIGSKSVTIARRDLISDSPRSAGPGIETLGDVVTPSHWSLALHRLKPGLGLGNLDNNLRPVLRGGSRYVQSCLRPVFGSEEQLYVHRS